MPDPHILLITRECLCTASNEGNVLLTLFEGLPFVCANIYCKPGRPDVDLCEGRYFQLTDRMAIQKLLHRRPMGAVVRPSVAEDRRQGEQENKSFYDFFRRNNWEIFHLARELLWQLADFRSPQLDAFVEDFAPDIIFAPLCYDRFALAVQRYVIQKAGCPAVTYLYDDLYSLRQWRFSPLFWFNRFLQRRAIRRDLPLYRFAYTMTEQQAAEYERMLGIPMRILRKCVDVQPAQRRPHTGVRLIYAGGVYYGRDKTLARVADAVRQLREQGTDVRLDIYTDSPLSSAAQRRLDDGRASFVHAAVPFTELQEKYAQSDIALHVESFHRKDALVTRLSFSTKIVDCLASGCAVLAVCPPINAGWQYLRDEGAALCVGDPREIEPAVCTLVREEAARRRYAQAAARCLRSNHEAGAVRGQLLTDLRQLLQGKEAGNDR